MTLKIKLAFILLKKMFVKTKIHFATFNEQETPCISILKSAGVTHNTTYDQQSELFYFLLIPIVNQFNIFEFFLLLNIKLENFLITLISKMFTLYPVTK